MGDIHFMRNPICHIVCAGENSGLDINLQSTDFLIAADGGLDYLTEIGVTPNLTVGDFDSANNSPQGEIIKLNCDKNETDTYICVLEGLKRGYNTFFFHCATGSRFDHTLANLQILTHLAKHNAQGYIFDSDQIITSLPECVQIEFFADAQGTVSVFSATDICEGVNIKGLKYELDNGFLSSEFSLGVSNSFIDKPSSICASKGILTVVFPKSALKFIK